MKITDFLDFHGRAHEDTIFCEDDEGAITYGEALTRVNKIANRFLALGLVKGTRIGVLARNRTEIMLLFYGAAKVGVVPVSLNARLTPEEWDWILKDAGCPLLFAEADLMEQLAAYTKALPELICLGADQSNFPSLEAWIKGMPSHLEASVVDSVKESDDFLQVYTSGTTGRPKGVVLVHGSSLAQVFSFAAGLGAPMGPGDCLAQNLPLFHIGGICITFYAICFGGTVLLRANFDPSEQLSLMEKGRISHGAMVPAMIQACIQVNGGAPRNFEKLGVMFYGAAPISDVVLREALALFDCGFVQIFGMTESHAVISFLNADSHERALSGENPHWLKSCGRPAPATQVRIVDEVGDDVAPGVRGEIICKGPQVMKEYWRWPEETAKTLVEGWLHTGDAGKLDEEGFLYIEGRIKDLIISGGENIAPLEIEDVLFSHADIVDAAVIAVPDEKWGEAVAAMVVLKPGVTLTQEDVQAFCRTQLAGFKIPKLVSFLEALPRNGAGKILKSELRAPYWQGADRQVS